MKIGELAKRTGLAPSTIRFYESKGLLNMVAREVNGYRAYPPEAVVVLTLIAQAQQTGFSLDEISQMLPQDLGSWRHEELVSALKKKVADIDAMAQRLAQSKAQLEAVIAMIEGKPDDMACQDNARRVMQALGLGTPAGQVKD